MPVVGGYTMRAISEMVLKTSTQGKFAFFTQHVLHD